MSVEVFVLIVVVWIVDVDLVVSRTSVVVVVVLVVSGIPVVVTFTIVILIEIIIAESNSLLTNVKVQLYILCIPFSLTHLDIRLSYKLYCENWIQYMVNLLRMA